MRLEDLLAGRLPKDTFSPLYSTTPAQRLCLDRHLSLHRLGRSLTGCNGAHLSDLSLSSKWARAPSDCAPCLTTRCSALWWCEGERFLSDRELLRLQGLPWVPSPLRDASYPRSEVCQLIGRSMNGAVLTHLFAALFSQAAGASYNNPWRSGRALSVLIKDRDLEIAECLGSEGAISRHKSDMSICSRTPLRKQRRGAGLLWAEALSNRRL